MATKWQRKRKVKSPSPLKYNRIRNSNQQQHTLHSVSKPDTSQYFSAAPEDPQSQQDQVAPLAEDRPVESNAPAINLPVDESQYDSASSEESTVEPSVSKQPALIEPSFGAEPAAPEGTEQDQFAPVFEAQPAVESGAPAINLPGEEPQFESAPAEASSVESPVSEQPVLEEPSFDGESAAPAENSEVPADNSVPSEGRSVESDVEADPFGGASFDDADAEFSSDPFGAEPAVQGETE